VRNAQEIMTFNTQDDRYNHLIIGKHTFSWILVEGTISACGPVTAVSLIKNWFRLWTIERNSSASGPSTVYNIGNIVSRKGYTPSVAYPLPPRMYLVLYIVRVCERMTIKSIILYYYTTDTFCTRRWVL